MKTYLKKFWFIILLSLLGILSGYLYWRFIGCTSGSCPITSHWYSSSLTGGIFGYLSGSIVSDYLSKSGQ